MRLDGIVANQWNGQPVKFDTRSHRSIDASLDWDGPMRIAQQTVGAESAWDRPVLFAQQNQRFLVLDACSDSQHLAR